MTPKKYQQESDLSLTIIYSHLVVAINFPIVLESEIERRRNTRKATSVVVYNLPPEHHEAILQQSEPLDIFPEAD